MISRSCTAPTRVRQLFSPGKRPITFVRFDLAERALEQIRRPPSVAVSRIAELNDERVEVVGEAASGGGEPFGVEPVDQGVQTAFAVLLADRFIERLPVGVLDAFAFGLGELCWSEAEAWSAASQRAGPQRWPVGDGAQCGAEPRRWMRWLADRMGCRAGRPVAERFLE